MSVASGGKPTGRVGSALNAARTLTDANATTADKTVEGAALAAQAAATAAAGTVAGAVVGQAVRSRRGRKLIIGAVSAALLVFLGGAMTVATAVQAATAAILEEQDAEQAKDDTCTPGGVGDTTGTARDLTAEQQANADAILGVVQARGLPAGDAVIAIMTALTESSLINVNHGDLAGPDSRGLFQQRDSWGPLEVRMDPAGATGLFLDRLTAPGLLQYEGVGVSKTVRINSDGATSRGTYPPWRVAQSVQISAFPMGENYRAQYALAVRIVSDMVGDQVFRDARVATWADQLGPTDPPVDFGDVDDPSGDDEAGCEDPPEPPADGPGPGAWGGHSNGVIPADAMCTPSWETSNILLRCDAVAQLEKLNVEFRRDLGFNLDVGQGYRDLATQECMYRGGCGATGPAAKPGTSNHGWALAIDINGTSGSGSTYENRKTTAVYRWMAANAPRFLFRENVSLKEAWHWEYHGAWTG